MLYGGRVMAMGSRANTCSCREWITGNLLGPWGLDPRTKKTASCMGGFTPYDFGDGGRKAPAEGLERGIDLHRLDLPQLRLPAVAGK